MNTCEYAKLIVDSVPKDGTYLPEMVMRRWIHNAPCCKDRMIRELTAYLMSLEDRQHAVRVAGLVKAACAKTGLHIPLLEMVEQRTVFTTGAYMRIPPSPDVCDDGFVLTSLADETPVGDDWELL
jgi:hypothetical protein